MKSCPYCGTTLVDNAAYCNICGRAFTQSYQQNYQQQSYQRQNQQYLQYPPQNQYPPQMMQGQQMQMQMNQQYIPAGYVPKSAKTAKTLGILSILLFYPLGIAAIICANKSKEETGGVLCKEAKRGRDLGVSALILMCFVILYLIVYGV